MLIPTPSFLEWRSSVRGAVAPSFSISTAPSLSAASSQRTPAATRWMFSISSYRSWNKSFLHYCLFILYVDYIGFDLISLWIQHTRVDIRERVQKTIGNPFDLLVRKGRKKINVLIKSQIDLYFNSLPWMRVSKIAQNVNRKQHRTWTKIGMTDSPLMIARLCDSLARIWRAPTVPSTISSIRTPSA